jgi:DNA (cytosine-5)-methyltransferase 1
MNELALFAGAGGGILGGQLLGWRTRCAVELDAYCRKVLLARQKDGHLEKFPIWDDVRTFDGRPWSGSIDIISGGFPCQDISVAGKRAGITGPKSSLWLEMARIIGEVRPRHVFVENTPTITVSGIDTVLSDLAQMGYNARWCCLSAEECGAPHKRNRWWCLATNPDGINLWNPKEPWGKSNPKAKPSDDGTKEHLANADGSRKSQQKRPEQNLRRWISNGSDETRTRCWWATEPSVGRVAHGMANRMDRLKALGNGQVPQVAAAAFNILKENQNAKS